MKRNVCTKEELPLAAYRHIVGVDEVGRGPLCGPVVAACASFKTDDPSLAAVVRDSKKLSEHRRQQLSPMIKAACHWSIASVPAARIDEINIFRATQEAFRNAIDRFLAVTGFSRDECLFVIDGNAFSWDGYPFRCVVKADATVPQVSAASIIAKVFRDRHMGRYAKLYPAYGFDAHKGYGTALHRAAIKAHGVLPIHRRSFTLLAPEDQISLF